MNGWSIKWCKQQQDGSLLENSINPSTMSPGTCVQLKRHIFPFRIACLTFCLTFHPLPVAPSDGTRKQCQEPKQEASGSAHFIRKTEIDWWKAQKQMDELTDWMDTWGCDSLSQHFVAGELPWTGHQHITGDNQPDVSVCPDGSDFRRSENPCRHMRSGKSPHTKRLQASLSSEATERSLPVATRMGREPLTSKGDARQGVRVSQVVGSLQKTTQHGWKRWQTLENVFDRSVPQPIWTISHMKWNHQRWMASRLSNGVQGVLTSQKEA